MGLRSYPAFLLGSGGGMLVEAEVSGDRTYVVLR